MNDSDSTNHTTLKVIIYSSLATFFLYHFITHLFYFPVDGFWGGREVFLTPRYFPPMNDLFTSIFRNWSVLPPLLAIYAVGIWSLNSAIKNTNLNFFYYLILLYIVSLIFVLAFHFFSPLGFDHLAKNSASINNGIVVGVLQLKSNIGWFDASPMQKLIFLIKNIFPTDCHFTIIGWTHPWGGTLVAAILHSFSEFIHPRNSALAFGMIITAFNNLLIPLVAILIKQNAGEFWARKSSLFLLFVPSVLFHISSMYDIVATVLIAFLLLLTFYLLRTPLTKKRMFYWMIVWSSVAILVAQWTYGEAIPLTVLFIFLCTKIDKKFIAALFLGVLCPVLLYFGVEYFLSSGQSFYIKRAISCVTRLGAFQVEARPYPLSQVANFTIISIMGGVLFLPSFVFSLMRLVRKTPNIDSSREFEYASLLLTILYLILLLFIRTPLEVERTWHWIFLFSWILTGRLLKEVKEYYWTIVIFQVGITLALALTIQDYY